MSRIDDILTGARAAIKNNATFATAEVLMRKELKADSGPTNLNVFLNIAKAKPNGQLLICDMRVYPLEVVVSFTIDGRTVDEDVKDAVNVAKGVYSDALKTALRTCQSFSTFPIANVYHVEWESEDLEYQEQGRQYGTTIAREYRIQQVWNFYTFESIPDQVIINIKDMGVAVLNASGTVTVLSAVVTTIDRIKLTKILGNNSDAITVTAHVAGTNFTITSAGGAVDSSLPIGWFIF